MNKSICMILLLIAPMIAWSKVKDSVNIVDARAEQNDSIIKVSFTVLAGSDAVREQRYITPVINWQDSASKELRPVVVESRRGRLVNQRKSGLDSTLIYLRSGNELFYNDSLRYESWMSSGMLSFRIEEKSCCETKPLQSQVKVPVLFADNSGSVKQSDDYSESEVESTKANSEGSKSYRFNIKFGVGEKDIDISIHENSKALDEIKAILEDAFQGSKNTPIKIEIIGYSSPEGLEESNVKLSHVRADALKNHLQNSFKHLNTSNLKARGGGEDWESLRKMVARSNMRYKSEVLRIIDDSSIPNNDMRKKKLQELRNGLPYKYMLKNFYPKLRSVQIKM